jgi:hypothetical protein
VLASVLLPAALAAAGAAGVATPAPGGGLAGPGQDGAAGLFFNPAAAHPAGGELLLDLQAAASFTSMALEGQPAEERASLDAIPALAIAGPLGPVGLGLALMAPYARSGDNGERSSLRFHSLRGAVQVLEADACLAAAPAPWITAGAALRVAGVTLETARVEDLGATLAGLVDGGEAMMGDPFLEGTRAVEGGRGAATGWAAGLRLTHPEGWGLSLDYRSPLAGAVDARLTYSPSDALAVQVTGDVRTWLVFPPEWSLVATIPAGRLTLSPELTRVYWSSWAVLESRVSGLSFTSSDPVLEAVLGRFGATLEGLLAGQERSLTVNGNRDIFSGGLGLSLDAGPAWTLLGGGWYTPASVPDATVTPGNLDFDTLDLRAGAVWSSRRRSELAVVGDVYLATPRQVQDSALDPLLDDATGLSQPSANGRYSLSLYRLGLTLRQGFGRGGRKAPEVIVPGRDDYPFEMLD